MPIQDITDVDRLKRINAALISRVERSMDQQGNAFSLFQTAINLENRVRSRTEELRSTLRRLEQSNGELVCAKESAEQANQSKTRFLAAASHDVLQPLNAAHLSVSALAEIQSTDEGRTLVRQVERSLETMEDLLHTLLDISKLDAGVVKPDLGDVQLEPLLASIIADFEPLAARKGIRLRTRIGGAVVRSDRTLLRRILQNIISNAVRYTKNGGVLVGVRSRGTKIRIDVVDTGCGIPDDQREAVFEEFHRGPVALDSEMSSGGLGLGLSIVRRMAEALDHPIGFTSRLGRGTVFRLEMPAAQASIADAPLHAHDGDRRRGYGLFGTRVLMVEDDEALRQAMEALLKGWQCDVRSASSARRTMDLLSDTSWTPDVIIADQHLDNGDLGNLLIERIRAHVMRDVPALIVTADTSPALSQAARSAGVELMRKPVKPAQLRALLAHLLA